MDASATMPENEKASKKRKVEDDEKTVIKVKKDEPSPDSWSWRKYGQKLIKGFTHPRGYYRCVTREGCSAKKQVDRSIEDSSILIITYTSTHNHPGPDLAQTHKSPKKRARVRVQAQAQYQSPISEPKPSSPNQEQTNNGNIENTPFDEGHQGQSPPNEEEEEPYRVSLDNLTPYDSQNNFIIIDEHCLDVFPQLKCLATSTFTQEYYDIFDEIDHLKDSF